MPAEVLDGKITMKDPSPQVESFVFNLGKATDLRCTGKNEKAFCGKCEVCLLSKKLAEVKTWVPKAGDQSKKRFLLGLIRRLHSPDLMKYVAKLMEPLCFKDYIYSRSRSNPSLTSDVSTVSHDHSLDVVELERSISETWNWFQSANYWTKSNFLIHLFKICEPHLLHVVGVQARTMVASEIKAFQPPGITKFTKFSIPCHMFDSLCLFLHTYLFYNCCCIPKPY